MATSHSDWIDLITEMLWVFERETKLTLRGINDNFQHTGLSFDGDFREHFLDIIHNRVSKTYEQFIRKLEFDELQRRLNDTDNDKWKHSTGYHDIDTPVRPIPAQKRKNLDEFIEANETFSVKRPRLDCQMAECDGTFNNYVMDMNHSTPNHHSNATIGNINGKYISRLDVIVENAVDLRTPAYANETSETTTLMNHDCSSIENNYKNTVSVEPHPERISTVKSTRKSIKAGNDGQLMKTNSKSAKSHAKSVQLPRVKRKLLRMSERNRKSLSSIQKVELDSSSACDEKSLVTMTPNQNVIKSSNPQSNSSKRWRFHCKACNYSNNTWKFRRHLTSNKHKRITQNQTNDDISKYGKPFGKPQFRTHYACHDCEYSGRKRSHLIRHLFSNRHNNWFQCHLCPKMCLGRDILHMHYAEHKQLCFKCGQQFRTKEMHRQHELECDALLFQCYICQIYEKDETKLKVHMKKHTRINPSMYKIKIKVNPSTVE